MTRKADIGIIGILATYLITLCYIVYEYITGGIKSPVDIAFTVGKNPYLFIINLILFMIGGHLILVDISEKEREKTVDIIFFLLPTVNLIFALLYLVAVAGGEGILFFGSEVYFILMYNLLLYLIGVALSLRRFKISKEVKIITGYIGLFILYLLVRIFIGVYPIIQVVFIFVILAYTLYIPRMK